MTKFLFASLATLIAFSFSALDASAAAAKAAKKKKGDSEVLFKKLDTDNDNKLSKAEFTKITENLGKKKPDAAKVAKKAGKISGKIDAEFTKLDENKNDSLSLEEFKKFSAKDLKGEKKNKKKKAK